MADLTSVVVSGTSSTGGAVNAPSAAETAIAPVFAAGQLGPYYVSVSNAVNLVNFQALFSVPNSILVSVSSSSATEYIRTAMVSKDFVLGVNPVGSYNVFKFDSTRDGQ